MKIISSPERTVGSYQEGYDAMLGSSRSLAMHDCEVTGNPGRREFKGRGDSGDGEGN